MPFVSKSQRLTKNKMHPSPKVLFALALFLLGSVVAAGAEESGVLLKGGVSMDAGAQSAMDAEDSQYEGKMGALDAAERGLELAHQNKLKAIEEQDSDTESIQIADEKDKHQRRKRDIERKRSLEEKLHAKRVADILKKAGRLASASRASSPRTDVSPPASGPARSAKRSESGSERPAAQPQPSSSDPLRDTAPSEEAPSGPAVEKWSDETIPGRMMKLAERMDKLATEFQDNAMAASNEFCGGMADALGRSAKFLAQKPGTVLPQMADAVVTYLTNDYNENNQAMYDDAVKAVDELQKNPARFFGEHAVDAAMSAAGGATQMAEARAAAAASKLAAAEKAGMGRLKKMQARQAKKLEQAAKKLESMAEDGRRFGSFNFKVGGGAPDYEKLEKMFPRGPDPVIGGINVARVLDKTQGNRNCFPVSLAAAKRWRTGRPYVAIDHNPHMPMVDPATGKSVYDDVFTDADTVSKVLKREYGGKRAKDPYHGGLDGLRDAREGVAVLSDQRKIEAAMQAGGKGSSGLVFVDAGDGTPGHVFNVFNNGGKVEFWDFQSEPPLQIIRFGPGDVVFQRGGLTVSSPLQWNRIHFYRLD